MPSLRFLVDQGISRLLGPALPEFDVVHVGDRGLHAASDGVILELARREGRVLITRDADFHQIVATTGASSPSIVRIIAEGASVEAIARSIRGLALRAANDLKEGCLVTTDLSRIRVRPLPILRDH